MKNIFPAFISILVSLLVDTRVIRPVVALGDEAPVHRPHGRQLKKEKKKGKSGRRSAERVVTLWWVLFNKPSACTGGGGDSPVLCAVSDLMGAAESGSNDVNVAVVHGTAGVSNSDGFLRLTSTIYKTECDLDLESSDGHYLWGGPPPLYANQGSSYGYCPADGETTEVHLVLRDHGPPGDGMNLLDQMTRFTDPSCLQSGGANTCVDIGVAPFEPSDEIGVKTKEFVQFPMFPPGCAESDDCTEMEEDVQIISGTGYLVVSDDAFQAVAEIYLPKV